MVKRDGRIIPKDQNHPYREALLSNIEYARQSKGNRIPYNDWTKPCPKKVTIKDGVITYEY